MLSFQPLTLALIVALVPMAVSAWAAVDADFFGLLDEPAAMWKLMRQGIWFRPARRIQFALALCAIWIASIAYIMVTTSGSISGQSKPAEWSWWTIATEWVFASVVLTTAAIAISPRLWSMALKYRACFAVSRVEALADALQGEWPSGVISLMGVRIGARDNVNAILFDHESINSFWEGPHLRVRRDPQSGVTLFELASVDFSGKSYGLLVLPHDSLPPRPEWLDRFNIDWGTRQHVRGRTFVVRVADLGGGSVGQPP